MFLVAAGNRAANMEVIELAKEMLIKRKFEYLNKNGRVSCKSLEIARGVIDLAAEAGIYVEGHKEGSYVGMGYWELRIRKGA